MLGLLGPIRIFHGDPEGFCDTRHRTLNRLGQETAGCERAESDGGRQHRRRYPDENRRRRGESTGCPLPVECRHRSNRTRSTQLIALAGDRYNVSLLDLLIRLNEQNSSSAGEERRQFGHLGALGLPPEEVVDSPLRQDICPHA
jgi:hypothetical protein